MPVQALAASVALAAVPDKVAIQDKVHPNVYRQHERYFQCPSCGTVFWHGSHVTHTCRKLGLTPPPDDRETGATPDEGDDRPRPL